MPSKTYYDFLLHCQILELVAATIHPIAATFPRKENARNESIWVEKGSGWRRVGAEKSSG